jgi:hypothetical protein
VGVLSVDFVHPPLLVAARDGKAYDFDVYAHLSRRLPRRHVSFTIDGRGTDSAPITLSRRPACYSTELYTGDTPPPPAFRHPRDGRVFRIDLRYRHEVIASARVRLKLVPRRTLFDGPQLTAQLRTIGCPAE